MGIVKADGFHVNKTIVRVEVGIYFLLSYRSVLRSITFFTVSVDYLQG